MISIEDVEYVALLGRLHLSEEEKKKFAGQLNDILDYVRKLEQLDTGDVSPTAHVLPVKNVFREDCVQEHLPLEKVLQNAPDRQGNFFRVPRIV